MCNELCCRLNVSEKGSRLAMKLPFACSSLLLPTLLTCLNTVGGQTPIDTSLQKPNPPSPRRRCSTVGCGGTFFSHCSFFQDRCCGKVQEYCLPLASGTLETLERMSAVVCVSLEVCQLS